MEHNSRAASMLPLCAGCARGRLLRALRSPWDVRDPVAEEWLTEDNALLLHTDTAQRVNVYHVRCSNG